MKFHVVTLFPEVIEAYTSASILGRAQKVTAYSGTPPKAVGKLLGVKTYQLRDFVDNKWGKADGRPYGGGPGMVLEAMPFIKATETKKTTIYRSLQKNRKIKVLITAAGGKPLTNAYAKKLAKEKEVIILCGRYEGIDSRVKKILRAEEVSVGPYILTGGEVPALAIIDATARQIEGVLGKFESLEESRIASHEIYTRPEVLVHKGKKFKVPKVLLSGHRVKIDEWKAKKRSKPE